ncbi:hypothetical protein [Sinorhizobium meliloti]|uniref:hypothetical protein n=1 Tax=Rhizobium meliloti TaxID=382 RepID=UPI000FDBEBF3|nr:hypothetical protein [Sinorhizobium meliloti]RVP00115.1 hypothetical protein CN109_34230 [Sinorhizobium meliloti]
MRGSFRTWLKEWEAKAGYYADAELYFCKPEPADRDYHWGKQYRWYFRFVSVPKHNAALDLEAHMASVEMLWLRGCLGIDAKKTDG